MFDKSGNGPNLVLISEKLCQFAYTKMALFCVSSALSSGSATLATMLKCLFIYEFDYVGSCLGLFD